MAHYVTNIETSWSAEEAFDYMADLRHFADWDPGVSSSVKAEDGPIGEGAAFDVKANGIDLRYVLVDFDRPRRVVAEANTDRLRSYDIIEVKPTEGGSIVTYDATLDLKGIFALASPIMALMFNRIGSKADAGLQRVLPDSRKVD